MGRTVRRAARAALFSATLAAAAPAGAQADPTAEARAHFERAVTLFEANDLRAALVEFERAYALSSRPSLLFNLAATHQALHQYPEAVDALQRFLAATEGQHSRQRSEAHRALRVLDALLATVRVACDPPTATLTVDGRAAAGDVLRVGPGAHVIEATADGRVTQRVEVVVASGDDTALRLVLPATPEAVAAPAVTAVIAPPVVAAVTAPAATVAPLTPMTQPTRSRPWFTRAWVWGATSGALAVGATITAVFAVQAHDEFQTRTMTDLDVDKIATRGRALAVATDVMAVGAVAAGVTALVVLARSESAAPTGVTSVWLQPWRGGGGVVAGGRF